MEPSPLGAALSVPVNEQDHLRGPADAPITLLEYGDYECPTCARTHPLIKQLLEDARGTLRFAFRHFPLNSVHPMASIAAQAAEAAGAQGKFWDMHDLLMEHIDDLAESDLTQYALRLGLNVYQFESDLRNEQFASRVQRDRQSGTTSGVHGTPALFINGERYLGQIDLSSLRNALRGVAGELSDRE